MLELSCLNFLVFAGPLGVVWFAWGFFRSVVTPREPRKRRRQGLPP